MTLFWVIAAVLFGLALLFVVLPLRHFRRNPPSGDELDQDQVNLAVHREQLDELEARLAVGGVDEVQYRLQRTELERALLDDIDDSQRKAERSNFTTPLVMAAFIPVLALGLYFQLGASDQLKQQDALEQLFTEQDPQQAVLSLERIVAQWPEDYQTRFMLAGAYMSSGRFSEAADEYEVIVNQTGGAQAEPVIQMAQALYMAADSQVNIKIEILIERALTIDPVNTTALGLAGIAAFEQGQYQKAAEAWQKLLPLTSEPVAREALLSGIARAKEALGESFDQVFVDAESDIPGSVKVRVSLDKELASLPASARVFVYARTQAMPMPLAIVPLTVGDLPRDVVLNDSQAMMDGVRLSDHEQVDIVARIALDGDVMQPDYESRVRDVEVGSENLNRLVISGDGA